MATWLRFGGSTDDMVEHLGSGEFLTFFRMTDTRVFRPQPPPSPHLYISAKKNPIIVEVLTSLLTCLWYVFRPVGCYQMTSLERNEYSHDELDMTSQNISFFLCPRITFCPKPIFLLRVCCEKCYFS